MFIFSRLSIKFITLALPSLVEMTTHCLVRWEDDLKQFAVVDTRRSKSVAMLKVGLTTCFEGYQRERRRGTILFLGMFLTFSYAHFHDIAV